MNKRIGPYRIESLLGEGGSGLVYKGRHETHLRYAAIRTFRGELLGDAHLRRRLHDEAQLQAGLSHEGIVGVYEFDFGCREPFIAMEYVDGESLARRLERGPLAVAEAVSLTLQILEALEHLHARAIVHRGVAPWQILVCGGTAKLSDLRHALLPGRQHPIARAQRAASAHYAAPEHLQGAGVDCRSDVYSAGVLFYAMVAGRPPFAAIDVDAQLEERHAGPRDLRLSAPDLSSGMWEAVRKALQADRTHRFQSASEFRRALRQTAAGFTDFTLDETDGAPWVAPQLPPAAPAAVPADLVAAVEPGRWGVAALVIVGAVGVAGYMVIDQADGPPATGRTSTTSGTEKTITATATATETATTTSEPAPDTSGTRTAQQGRNQPGPPAERATEPTPPVQPQPSADEEEDRRRAEISASRAEVQRILDNAEWAIREERFGEAVAMLQSASQQTHAYPTDLWQERDAIDRLHAVVRAAELANAQWEKQLAQIEELLERGLWPEAKNLARLIADDPQAPAAVAARAHDLARQATEGLRRTFDQTTVGPTTNKLRKPSTPSRKNQ